MSGSIKLTTIGLAVSLLLIGAACGGEGGSANESSLPTADAAQSTQPDSAPVDSSRVTTSAPAIARDEEQASTSTTTSATTSATASATASATTTTTSPIATTTTVTVPEPTVTEAEVADLEQQLDEIDQVLTEIELDLSQD